MGKNIKKDEYRDVNRKLKQQRIRNRKDEKTRKKLVQLDRIKINTKMKIGN